MIAKYDTVEVFDSLKEVSAGFVRRFYTEEGLHRPNTMLRTSGGTTAPWYNGTVLFSASDYVPRKGEEWSVLRLDATNSNSDAVLKACFVCLTKDDDDPYSKFYGWVDSAEIITGAGPSTTVVIRWHLDYYLTFMAGRLYQDSITLGAGRVKRITWKDYARPDPSNPRRWVQTAKRSLTDTTTVWAIIAYTISTDAGNNQKNTTINYLTWKPGVNIESGGTTYRTPSIDQIYAGLIEEVLGLDPNAVIGAWLSPIEVPYAGAGIKTNSYDGNDYAAYKHGIASQRAIYVRDMGSEVKTDDITKYVFTDATGAEMFTAPWGLNWRYWFMQVDYGASGCNLQVYLMDEEEYNSSEDDFTKAQKAAEGRLFSFPLPALPITENAWQSYNYSGQREYDIQAREMQKNQNAVNGISGIATGAITGAIAGSMVAPGPGTAIGAVAGIGASVIGLEASYFSSGYYDIKGQQAIDKLTASQTAGMIITAGGIRGLKPFGKGGDTVWELVTMERDDYSKQELEAEQAELGYITDMWFSQISPMPDVADTNGTAWRIEGVEVKGTVSEHGGSLCAEGRRYIAALFSRGVHIDLIQ